MSNAAASEPGECIFCAALNPEDLSPLLVFRGERAFVILNKFPYSNGHLMVVPVRHVGRMADAGPDELYELIALTRTAEMALTETYKLHGLNVGINLGRAAGAGVLEHLHIHVVPRWEGDTNFMTTVSGTRVVPEEPEHSVSRLKPVFERFVGTQK